MASARRIGPDDAVRVVHAPGRLRDLLGLLVVVVGLFVGVVVLRRGGGGPAPSSPGVSEPRTVARAGEQPGSAKPRDVTGGGPEAAREGAIMPSTMPKTRGGQLRALRRLGIAPTRGPDGKPRLDAAPVIDALHAAGVHEGIGAFPPHGTDPPKSGVIVPDGVELPEGYVRHYQTTDDGAPLAPILMFHPDYDFVDAEGRPIAVPPDRIVPPELVPPGFPVEMLHVPEPAH